MEMFNQKNIRVIKLDHCNPYGIIILDDFHHQITLPWTNISHPWWHFLKMTVLFLRVGHVSSLEGRSKTWDAKSELFGTNQLQKSLHCWVSRTISELHFSSLGRFTTYPPCIGVMPFFLVNGGNGWVAESSCVFHVQAFFCGIRDSTKTGELTQGGPINGPPHLSSNQVTWARPKRHQLVLGSPGWVSPTLGSLWKKSSTQKKCLLRGVPWWVPSEKSLPRKIHQ